MKTKNNPRQGDNTVCGYDESAVAQRRVAMAEDLRAIADGYERCAEAWQVRGQSNLTIVNEMRELGHRFNRCAGPNHQQLTFTIEGLIYFRQHLAPVLPQKITPEWAKCCVHLARLMPEPATTPKEAEQWIQHVQQAFGFYAGTRGPEHPAPPSDVFTHWLVMAKRLSTDTEKLLEAAPIERLDVMQLDAILKNTAPVAAIHELAKARRLRLSSRTISDA